MDLKLVIPTFKPVFSLAIAVPLVSFFPSVEKDDVSQSRQAQLFRKTKKERKMENI